MFQKGCFANLLAKSKLLKEQLKVTEQKGVLRPCTCTRDREGKDSIKEWKLALPGVAQWIEHWTVNQRVSGSIPGQGSQGTILGCRSGPQ